MRTLVPLVVVVVAAAGLSTARRFTKCELATLLETSYGMTREEVKNWVCIAQYESSFNTGAVNKNRDGSRDYGLFQINNKYWCDDHYGKNVCRIPCSALLNDDPTEAVQCARKIVQETERWKGRGRGLTAWVAYTTRCANMDLDAYIADCDTQPHDFTGWNNIWSNPWRSNRWRRSAARAE